MKLTNVYLLMFQRRSLMYWNAVLLMAWSLTTVSAFLDSTKSQRYWEDVKPEDAISYPNDNAFKTYAVRGGNKHFVTSVFPGICRKSIQYLFFSLFKIIIIN